MHTKNLTSLASVALGAILLTLAPSVEAMTYYISPTGDDQASGTTVQQAWATFDRAWKDLYPGDTLLAMDGTYYQVFAPNVRNGQPNPAIDTADYVSYPLDHTERTKCYITVKAMHDGKAVIDGQNVRSTMRLGHWEQGGFGSYFILEGLIARNSIDHVYYILSHNVIIRRCSGYNANTDENTHVFGIYAQGTPADPANILLEDCVAGGSGRKMFMAYSTYVNVIFRRLFAAWGEWRGAGPTYRPNNWPWGDGIEIYNSDQPAGVTNSIVENSIVYGKLANYGFSLAPNPALTQGNKFLGDMAVKVGMRWDGTPMRGELSPDEGGDLIPDMTKDWPCPNPARTDIHCTEFTKWQGTRAGFDFGVYSVPTFLSNTFQDLFAWGNAGPGIAIGEPPISIGWDPSSSGNVLNRVTLVNNGLGDPPPWEKLQGYPNIADYSLKMINRAGGVQNLYIEGDTRYADKSAGARLRYRYVNGQLMDGSNGQPAQELWPWPMEQRVKDELGISVTCELGNLINQYAASPITNIAMDAFCTGKDTVAPSVPASVAAGPVSASRINLSWPASTDNVAVAGYRIYRNGSVTGTAASNLYADTGLTPATGYTYTVSAYDAAGNMSAPSSAAFATTLAPDTIPPSVNIIAPSSGVAVSGVLAVSAKASDNVGVVGVQFKLDGAGLGAETTVSPYSVSWNTGGIANGKHVLTAVARDVAGNQTSSAQVTVSVANSVSVNPVAAYSFDQGLGTTLTDSSGNGHDGAISNGTWRTGRFGKALSFSGNGFVRIGDLDVSPALTVSAWINASSLSGCHSAVMKTFTYGFEICDGNLLAEIGNGSSWSGTTKIAAAANVWQYITETFDGSTITLYKDGVLVASSAGTLTNSSQDLRIGAWTDASEFFVGLIDEVRIYSRALSQAEVQADMNTPVGGTGDVSAPSVPLGLTAAAQSYSQINLSWSASTDNVGVTGYRINRNGSAIATTAAATYKDTGLSPLATYTYTISAYDAAGNMSAQSLPASATTAAQPDTIAPAVAITVPKPNQSVSGTIIVSATASDNIEVKGVQIKLDGASLGAEATVSPYAVSWDTSGVGAGVHVLTAVARDAAGNQTRSTPVTVSVSAATGPLSVLNISDNRSSYPNERIPRYAKLEVTFDVRNTVATNLQLPFDPNPPTGINPGSYPLHKGISVDLLVTRDNWATVHRQPAFVYQGYDDQMKVSWSGRNREWHYPSGSLVWKARFSPNQPGTWQYKIVAQDSSGSTESAVQTVAVSTSGGRGFVKVSKKDPRYFEFDDGSPFTTIGLNEVLHFDDPTLNMEPLFQAYAANGVNFLRLWASGLYGSAWLEWIGGRNIYDGYLPRAGLEAFHDAVSNQDQLTQVIKYDGANLNSGWYDACRFQFWDDPESVKPNTTYKLSIKYWGKDIAGPRLASQADYGLVGKITTDWVPNCHEPGTGTVITGYGQSTSNWSTIEGTWYSGSNNFLPRIYLGLENATQGKVYIDSISLREDSGQRSVRAGADHRAFHAVRAVCASKIILFARQDSAIGGTIRHLFETRPGRQERHDLSEARPGRDVCTKRRAG